MSEGSRGLFDWTWKPFGQCDLQRRADVVPARTRSLPTIGTISAGMRLSCADASVGSTRDEGGEDSRRQARNGA